MLDLGTTAPGAPLVIDCFAGGGGASTGIEAALGRAVDVAINHDPEAIAMHRANHPATRHFCKSVYQVSPHEATRGAPVALAWFSPDCKHFSKAKGARPVKRTVRDLAWTAVEWARRVRPKVIILENVEEFQKWGPVLEDGRPCPDRQGQTFTEFVKALRRQGYAVEWKELRACDYGVPTIRKRLFLIARRDGLPITWPDPAHGPGLKPYRTAAEIIDWSLPCPSIFDRKKPPVEATCRRIAKGIVRHVLEAEQPFIVPVTHQGDARAWPMAEPLRTVTTANRGEFALVSPTLVQTGYGERQGQAPRVPGLDKPLGTVVAGGAKHAVVSGFFARQFGRSIGHGCADPLGTVTAGGSGKTALVAAFMAQHNTGAPSRSAAVPLSTLTGRCTQQQVVAAHLTHFHSSNVGSGGDVRQPLKTITAGGRHAGLVASFLVKYYGEGGQWQGCGEPLGTVTTRDRYGLVVVDIQGASYVLADIGMRMLTQREQFRAQGFPESYVIGDRPADGLKLTKTAQQKMCGNSVCPGLAEALVRANAPAEAFAERVAA